jgi:para-nitrobenzyl esterase
MNKISRSLAMFLLLAGIAMQTLAATVVTDSGTLHGQQENDLWSFLGVPYAQAPVANLRWQPPLPYRSEVEYKASDFGPVCPQPRLNPSGAMDEDCLSLNIWTPGLDDRKRPVMVWIHGGGFRTGSGIVPGEILASQDVVFASFNYRLGPLGFFAHESLQQDDANFGLLDMQLALQWIQDHIERFGGDPDNVTIFGVSAGGQAVNMLMVTPSAEGLFARGIAQSGYATWALARSNNAPDSASSPAPLGMDLKTAPSAEKIARELVASISDAKQSEAMLRQLDGTQLALASLGFQLPIVDGHSLLEEPALLFQRGQQHKLPLMTGGNSGEGSVMPFSGISAARYTDMIGVDRIAAARKLYAGDFALGDEAGLQRMFGDNRYLLSARVLGDAMSATNTPTWLYYFDYLNPEQRHQKQRGASHGSDGYLLFMGSRHPDPGTRQLAELMQGYWLNFARNGNPNSSQLAPWPAYSEKREWQRLGSNQGPSRGVLRKKLDLLESHYKARVHATY